MAKARKPASTEWDETEGCDGCRYPGAPLTPYETTQIGLMAGRKKYLCDLCANTMVGMHIEYDHTAHTRELEVMRTINYVGNVILTELRRRNFP